MLQRVCLSQPPADAAWYSLPYFHRLPSDNCLQLLPGHEGPPYTVNSLLSIHVLATRTCSSDEFFSPYSSLYSRGTDALVG